jgi:hypothetical protein
LLRSYHYETFNNAPSPGWPDVDMNLYLATLRENSVILILRFDYYLVFVKRRDGLINNSLRDPVYVALRIGSH